MASECIMQQQAAKHKALQFTVYSFYASRNILLVHKLKERHCKALQIPELG
jgi:hypothetical protein